MIVERASEIESERRLPGYTAAAQLTCRIRCGPAAPERGNQRGGVESRPGGESDGERVRSAALSARARQLTPEAGEREKLR